jgi:hypothetical protein
VALGLLDVRQRAVSNVPAEAMSHWGLAHFLIDGHHKLEAGAATGAKQQLLSLVSIDYSLSERGDIERLPQLLRI